MKCKCCKIREERIKELEKLYYVINDTPTRPCSECKEYTPHVSLSDREICLHCISPYLTIRTMKQAIEFKLLSAKNEIKWQPYYDELKKLKTKKH